MSIQTLSTASSSARHSNNSPDSNNNASSNDSLNNNNSKSTISDVNNTSNDEYGNLNEGMPDDKLNKSDVDLVDMQSGKIDPALDASLSSETELSKGNHAEIIMHGDSNGGSNPSNSAGKSLFISHLNNLNESISQNLTAIDELYPVIFEKNFQFKSYIDYITNGEFIKFKDFIAKLNNNELQHFSYDDSMITPDPGDPTYPSRAMQARINNSHTSLYQPHISFIPGTRIPDIDLNNQAKTVKDVWDEWTVGHKNKPSLSYLEKTYGTRWRRGRIAKSAQRRKKIIEFIESEYRKHSNVLKNINVVVKDLEYYRISKGKGLFWLYGALPDRLYNDAGQPIFKPPANNLVKENESAGGQNLESKSEEISSQKVQHESEQKIDIDNENIDDDLKDVDSSIKSNKIISATSENNQNPNIDDEVDEEGESVTKGLNHMERNVVDEEDEDEDDEDDDDDDVNMQSVADVAAMAALTVEGEDEDHALVNSAALAAAAQHVADQQRRRYQQKKSQSKSQLSQSQLKQLQSQLQNHQNSKQQQQRPSQQQQQGYQSSSNQNQEMSEFLNEDNTDPALSKL